MTYNVCSHELKVNVYDLVHLRSLAWDIKDYSMYELIDQIILECPIDARTFWVYLEIDLDKSIKDYRIVRKSDGKKL